MSGLPGLAAAHAEARSGGGALGPAGPDRCFDQRRNVGADPRVRPGGGRVPGSAPALPPETVIKVRPAEGDAKTRRRGEKGEVS